MSVAAGRGSSFRPCTAEREELSLLCQNVEKDQREILEIPFWLQCSKK